MKIKVWTRQHISVLADIEQTGRYVPTKERIKLDTDHHELVLIAYDWLKEQTHSSHKPDDATYPIWVSPIKEATMMPSPTHPILELLIDPGLITKVNINKWGAILNFSYLPFDEADAKRHRTLLAERGLSDAQIVMSRFYPELKRDIISSWSRLFDESINLGGDSYYGIIWELKKDWIHRTIN